VVKGGVVLTAANVDPAWLGRDARALLAAATGWPPAVLNDADAAGLAEVRFGAGRGERGVVLMLTLGTGVGTALFADGVLVPNAQLGQVPVRGAPGDRRASDAARRAARLSWAAWARRLEAFLAAVDAYVWPDPIVIGGGVSEEHARFVPRLRARARVAPARLGNRAGIVGAAPAARASGP
jgi:polyphosphate glucokinase